MASSIGTGEAAGQLARLFESYTGTAPERISALSSSGSHRRYYRLLSGSGSIIGVSGIDSRENAAFCEIGRHFASKGINVPEIYAISADNMYYLQEDLGNVSLFDRIASGRIAGRYSSEEEALLAETIRQLPVIQIEGADGLDFGKCYPKTEFDMMSAMFDLHYFKYCFLKNTGIDFNEVTLEEDFVRFAGILTECPDKGFMYRDFQSRNVMVKDGAPYFIDFQDGRKGPLYYDLASFVWQARSAFPPGLRKRLVSEYVSVLKRYRSVDEGRFMENLRIFVLFRTLQVLGAYGFRGYMERKRHFIDSIPYAIANLNELISGPGFFGDGLMRSSVAEKCPYLVEVLSEMVSLPGLAVSDAASRPVQELEVEIVSFSYRKGIPEDRSGNGGGYVFDCRAIHNPGKYEQYKSLTGMDAEVKSFLEKNGEVLPFMENVCALADAHVEKYLRRGFTHLMFCFGCTGGQHRSVYCAEYLASHISGRPGVKVHLRHREQNVEKEM